MLSIIAIGLLGKLFQILSLQPFHEVYYDDNSVWTEPLSLKTVSVPVSSFPLMSLVYIECAGYLYTNCDVKWQTCMFTSWQACIFGAVIKGVACSTCYS